MAELMHTSNAGGSMLTEVTDVAVIPCHCPSSVLVTTLTVVAKHRMAPRKSSNRLSADFAVSADTSDMR